MSKPCSQRLLEVCQIEILSIDENVGLFFA